MGFSTTVSLLAEPNIKGRSTLQQNLQYVNPSGGTALYDSIVQGVILSIQTHQNMPEEIRPFFKPLLVVITDGEDTESKAQIKDAEQVLQLLERSPLEWEILLVGINLNDQGKRAMRSLEQAGGSRTKFRDISNPEALNDVFQHIAMVLQKRTMVLSAPL